MPSPAEKKRADQVLRQLRKAYPDADCELDFTTTLELAVGVILSAQCTDKRVNQVTPALFRKYQSAAEWAKTPQATLEDEIRSTGFFRNKAKSIIGLCRTLVEKYEGEFPEDMDELVKLPGIGRKSANVLLISAFNKPGITVDTHCKRVSRRLGFTRNDNPDKIEFDLKELLPEKDWCDFSHCIIFHGRRRCHARKPMCEECEVAENCLSCGKV